MISILVMFLYKGFKFWSFFSKTFVFLWTKMDGKKRPLCKLFQLKYLGKKRDLPRGRNKVVVPTMFPWREGNYVFMGSNFIRGKRTKYPKEQVFLNVWQESSSNKLCLNHFSLYHWIFFETYIYIKWACILDLKLWWKKKLELKWGENWLLPKEGNCERKGLSCHVEQFPFKNKFLNVWQEANIVLEIKGSLYNWNFFKT